MVLEIGDLGRAQIGISVDHPPVVDDRHPGRDPPRNRIGQGIAGRDRSLGLIPLEHETGEMCEGGELLLDPGFDPVAQAVLEPETADENDHDDQDE